MGLLSALLPSRRPVPQGSGRRSSLGYSLFDDGDDGATLSGTRVTPDKAEQIAAVFACVRVLSETLASLPLVLYRRLPSGGKERATEHPLYDVLHNQPNTWQTSFEWREMMQGHLALRGNAYSIIQPGIRGNASNLVPIHPDRVKVERLITGTLRYDVKDANGKSEYYLQDEMLHLKAFSADGITGRSPIAICKPTVGLTQAADDFGASFFGNDSRPGGVLRHPEKMAEGGAQELRDSWERLHRGRGNRHRIAVLEEGLDWKQIGVNPEEAQFLETRKLQINEIARIFRVPPHMIADLERATFSNIEQMSLEFIAFTMLPWLQRWEQVILRDLITEPEVYFAEFLVDGLLRGDTLARYQAHAIGRTWGWLSANDVRGIENMNPIEGGDIYLSPSNMLPADQIGKVPAMPEIPNNKPQITTDESEGEQDDKEAEGKLNALVIQLSQERQMNAALARDFGILRGQYEALRIAHDAAAQASDSRDQQLAVAREQNAQQAKELEECKQCKTNDQEHVQRLLLSNSGYQEAIAGLAEEIAERKSELATIDQRQKAALAEVKAAHDAVRQQALAAFGAKLQETLCGMLEIEQAGVLRAARKPNFLAELDAFYGKHAARLEHALGGLVAVVAPLCGKTADCAELASGYVAGSKASLLELSGTVTAAGLADAVKGCVDRFDDRALALSHAMLAQLSDQPVGDWPAPAIVVPNPTATALQRIERRVAELADRPPAEPTPAPAQTAPPPVIIVPYGKSRQIIRQDKDEQGALSEVIETRPKTRKLIRHGKDDQGRFFSEIIEEEII